MQHTWQQQLRDSVTDLSELCQLLKLDPEHASLGACKNFKLRVPRPFIARMKVGDINDPLLLQALPRAQELLTQSGYSFDPLQETSANKVPGLLHKYHGRVLLLLAGACAINCRYCFRRQFPYVENSIGESQLQAIINYIEQDPTICEVILSGGDPLIVKDQQLHELIAKLEQIPHLRYLRFHTRLPIMLPERVTSALRKMLIETRLKCSIVLHCNHPQEIDTAVELALAKLSEAKIQLFNQSVLLKNINDDADTLIALSHRLYALNVVPYYLHMLDQVSGTAHFAVEKTEAKILIDKMRAQLPGYLVPKLVCEIANEPNKTYVV